MASAGSFSFVCSIGWLLLQRSSRLATPEGNWFKASRPRTTSGGYPARHLLPQRVCPNAVKAPAKAEHHATALFLIPASTFAWTTRSLVAIVARHKQLIEQL